MAHRCFAVFVASFVFVALGLATQAVPTYTLTDLGPVDSTSGRGYAITNAGVIAATAGFSTPDFDQAFIWSSGSRSHVPTPGDFSAATCINASNACAGYWRDSTYGIDNAFVYSAGIVSTLSPLGSGVDAHVYCINDQNTAVGATASGLDFSDPVATVWTNGMPSTIPGVNGLSSAWGINGAGQIVGETSVLGLPGMYPFSYADGVLTTLSLPDGFSTGAAYAVNDLGHVVGAGINSDGHLHAIVWQKGVALDLGALMGDNDNDEVGVSEALSINHFDEVVGTCPEEDIEDDNTGFLWVNGTAYDLDFLANTPGTQWQITAAQGINDYGEIVGTALTSGQFHAILLTPTVNLSALAASPSTVDAGAVATGTVSLDFRAPRGGATISLSVDKLSAVTVPSNVTVPPLATSVSFPIITHGVLDDVSVTITARWRSQTQSATLLIKTTNQHIDDFTLNPGSIFDGQGSTGTISMRFLAPPGGTKVTLTNSDPAVATIPTSVIVPAGSRTKTFTCTGHAPTTVTQTTFTATYGVHSLQQILHVNPIQLASLDLTLYLVNGGTSVVGAVRIPVAAPSGGYKVSLSNSNPAAATIPTSVTIPAKGTSASFTITTKPQPTTAFANITATHNSFTITKNLQIMPPEVASFTVTPSSVKGGKNATGKVTLTSKAPTGGMVINLTFYPSYASVTGTVKVGAGGTSVSFPIKTSVVTSPTSVRIDARALSVVKSAFLAVTP